MISNKSKHRRWSNEPNPEVCCVCGAPRNAYIFFDDSAGYLHNYHAYCDEHLPPEKMGPGIPPPSLILLKRDLVEMRAREREISWASSDT